MAVVITTGATVACSLSGALEVSNAAATVKLTVAGEPVAVASGVSTWTVEPNTCQATNPSGGSPSPCASVGSPTEGLATKLVVGGSPVLLDSFAAPSVGSVVLGPVHVVRVESTSSSLLEAG